MKCGMLTHLVKRFLHVVSSCDDHNYNDNNNDDDDDDDDDDDCIVIETFFV